MSKNVEKVKLILQASTSKNLLTFMGLHIASYHGLTEIVRLLVSNGASLEVSDEWGYIPLHYAHEEGHVQEVESLRFWSQ